MAAAPELRFILEDAQRAAAPPKDIKPAVLTVGGWFDAEDLLGLAGSYDSTPTGRVRAEMCGW